jgi:PIN domain nuclease of toxin-antitoxin system
MRKSTTSMSRKDVDPAVSVMLDTHIIVWLRKTSARLKAPTLKLIEDKFYEGRLCVSAISAWEIGLLVAQNKLDLGQPPLVWFEGFVQKFKANVLDVTPEIAINSNFLPGEFHRDPADRILVATAMVHGAAVVTSDRSIVSYGEQGFVEVIRADG